MKKALLKDTGKQILRTYKRFISILLMSLLGVGFFAGIRAGSPDMKKTVDKYFDTYNFYDIQVVSTLGLTDDDVKALEKIEGVESVIPSFSTDAILATNDNTEVVVKVHQIEENINNLKLIDGYMASTNSECVVEKSLIDKTDIKIGDYIELEEENESFITNRCKIVGTVESPLYISKERGTTSLGSGKISYYIYVPKSNIDSDIYSEIYMTVKDVKELQTISDEYDENIKIVVDRIENIKEERQTDRYDTLIADATKELDDASKTLEKEKKDAEEKIADAEKEIKEGKQELLEGKQELNEEKEKANKQISDAEEEIRNGYNELNSAEVKLNEETAKAETGFEEAENKKAELQVNLDQVIQGLEEIDSNIKTIDTKIKQYGNILSQSELAVLNQTKAGLNQKKKELEENQQTILAAIKMIDTEISNGKKSLEDAKAQILEGYKKLDEANAKLNEEKVKANNEFAKAEKEIKDAEKEISDGEKELEEKKKEFEEKITDAENKLIDAREELNDIEEAKWYIFDRNDNTGYNSYSQATENIAKLGDVFPIVFFVIATLISLTTMTRMVEENRTQIGTFKALGYTNKQIATKYIIYAFCATTIGGIIGMFIGFYTLPRIIITMYQAMYTSMDLIIEFNMKYAVIGLGTMLACILGATIYTVKKELKAMPAELMRPKSPKAGKSVFLEHIGFIWKRLSFIQKVTLRNMFRYKKRFLMTVIGIAGCTGLIVAGFGLKDSISGIMEFQYNDVYNYNMMITLKNTLTTDEITSFEEKLAKKEEIGGVEGVYIEAATLIKDDEKEELQIIVEKEKDSLNNGFINLKDVNTGEKVSLDDETIFITEKVANTLGLKVGDEIILEDNEKQTHTLKIGRIVENYIYHYIYMSDNLYEKTYGKNENINVLYIRYSENFDVAKEHELSKEILDSSKTSTVIFTSDSKDVMNDTIKTMNFVVYILIASAGVLAFVVLYNLSNINISERIRELATIKVLGFYDKEVYNYVTREIILLTIIGIILGLLLGFILTSFILGTCEPEALRFKKVVEPISYIYGIIITVVFSYIVNIVTYFSLKKVDMIESLKSVE